MSGSRPPAETAGTATDAAVDRTPVDDADVCVIGAGPAGGIVADRLAEAGYEVVILEAGPRFDPDDRRSRQERAIRPAYSRPDVWDGDGERDAYTNSNDDRFYPLNHARAKGVGGSTLHWQGMVMRLHEDDFNSASARGVGVDWPIDYAELRPYYAAAERELGVAGADDNPFAPPREEPHPLPAFPPSYSDSLFAEACEELEIAMHSVPNARNSETYDGRSACVGYGTCQPVCPSGAKYDATVHVERAERKGATVIDRAPVQHLEHDADAIEAAVYATPDDRNRRQSADAFVVACGGVETPRLLLLSDSSDYPDGLANSSGLVGRFFMDHLFAGTGGVIDEPTRQNHVGFLTSESHQFYDEADEEYAPFKLEFFNYDGPSPVEMALTGDDWGDELLERLRSEYGNHIGMGALVEQLPREDSYVALDPDRTDDRGNPVPDVHWTVDDRALRTIERVTEIQREILGELGAEITWQVGPDDTGPAYHHMGTTRMGADPTQSVVGPDLCTHDLENCWIASSSVFPTGGAMNPTLTIAALALKAADHVRETLS
ncbi:GMC family oxidoreductase [Halopiger djelfimassiliensis]|uniref:GMC family oxidoreductase n=1 Tax=Halopiger djelfimassiliensis TaxID=1293047 RepID=UPI000677BF13|nr:GMC family oxidoreductase [Halopiger djelfimassiliensis]